MGDQDGREVHKVGKVVIRELFKVLNWNLHSFRLLEIIQVLDSISWVRCASGNVSVKSLRVIICVRCQKH